MAEIHKIQYTIDHYTKVDNQRLDHYLSQLLGQNRLHELEETKAYAIQVINLMPQALSKIVECSKSIKKYDEIQPALDACVQYFRKNNDHINDHEYGLYGLLDDTYFTLKVILTIQDWLPQDSLPFQKKDLKNIIATLRWMIGDKIANALDIEALAVHKDLLLQKIKEYGSTIPKPTKLTLTDGTYKFPFDVYKMSDNIDHLNNKIATYAITRLDTENGRQIHKIIYIGYTDDAASLLTQNHPQGNTINTYKPSHICFYFYETQKHLEAVRQLLTGYYKPPCNPVTTTTNKNVFSTNTPSYTPTYTPTNREKQCPDCSGSSVQTCYSCGGSGGRYQSRVDYDWDGRPMYRDEWVNCYSCSGGVISCTRCGGSGTVMT